MPFFRSLSSAGVPFYLVAIETTQAEACATREIGVPGVRLQSRSLTFLRRHFSARRLRAAM
jgi:hypothetical protein